MDPPSHEGELSTRPLPHPVYPCQICHRYESNSWWLLQQPTHPLPQSLAPWLQIHPKAEERQKHTVRSNTINNNTVCTSASIIFKHTITSFINDRSGVINTPHAYAQSRREPEEVYQWEHELWNILRIARQKWFILNEKSNWHGVRTTRSISKNPMEYQHWGRTVLSIN